MLSYILLHGGRPIGCYSTEARASLVKSAVPGSFIIAIESDFPSDELQAGLAQWRVRWSDILTPGSRVTSAVKPGRWTPDAAERWDSNSRTYVVYIWASSQAAAETAADARRQAFITNNNLS